MSKESLRPTAVSIPGRSTVASRKRFRLSANTLFQIALIGSIGAHAIGFAYRGTASAAEERLVQIPVVLEAEEPPPPEAEPPPPKPNPKPRPAMLPKNIEKVVETDGLRSGDLVDADVGDYAEEPDAPVAEPEPAPPPPPPPPPPPEPKVDKVKLTRDFLANVRGALAARKVYPFSAERMGVSGSVTVSFVVEPNGSFSAIQVRSSSGHDVLDNAALQTVRGLSGQIARPAELGNVPLRTSVVLRYALGS